MQRAKPSMHFIAFEDSRLHFKITIFKFKFIIKNKLSDRWNIQWDEKEPSNLVERDVNDMEFEKMWIVNEKNCQDWWEARKKCRQLLNSKFESTNCSC